MLGDFDKSLDPLFCQQVSSSPHLRGWVSGLSTWGRRPQAPQVSHPWVDLRTIPSSKGIRLFRTTLVFFCFYLRKSNKNRKPKMNSVADPRLSPYQMWFQMGKHTMVRTGFSSSMGTRQGLGHTSRGSSRPTGTTDSWAAPWRTCLL